MPYLANDSSQCNYKENILYSQKPTTITKQLGDTNDAERAVVKEVISPTTSCRLHGYWRMDLHLVFSLVEHFAWTTQCRHDVL